MGRSGFPMTLPTPAYLHSCSGGSGKGCEETFRHPKAVGENSPALGHTSPFSEPSQPCSLRVFSKLVEQTFSLPHSCLDPHSLSAAVAAQVSEEMLVSTMMESAALGRRGAACVQQQKGFTWMPQNGHSFSPSCTTTVPGTSCITD